MKNFMILKIALVAISAAALGGCGASLPSLPTTGSLLGGQSKAAAANANPNDPLARTMDVAATSARALKCGYNFDPVKLKGQFIASETAANPADAPKLSQVYDTAFNGVSKALAEKGADYCSELKAAKIKLALTRHLNGDYKPSPPEPPEDGGGLLSGWGSGGSSSSEGVNTKQIFEN